VVARSAGALFIRSYERGERVHLAMLSRGYTGSLTPGTPTTGVTTPGATTGATTAAPSSTTPRNHA